MNKEEFACSDRREGPSICAFITGKASQSVSNREWNLISKGSHKDGIASRDSAKLTKAD